MQLQVKLGTYNIIYNDLFFCVHMISKMDGPYILHYDFYYVSVWSTTCETTRKYHIKCLVEIFVTNL